MNERPDRRASGTARGLGLGLALLLAIGGPTSGLGAQEPESRADSAVGSQTIAVDDIASLLGIVDVEDGEERSLPIAMVEFFGLRRLEEDSLRAALGLPIESEEEADGEEAVIDRTALPFLAVRLAGLSGVEEARLETACCHAGKAILYVGIREQGREPRGATLPAPEEASARLPEPFIEEYRDYLDLLRDLQAAEDPELQGARPDSVVADSATRSFRRRLAALAGSHLPELHEVLRTGADPEHRAVAALALEHSVDPSAAARDLARALRDPDPGVRAGAARSLGAIVVRARRRPEAEIRMPVEPLAELLGSTDWKTRNLALSFLLYAAGPEDEETLATLRRTSWAELAEMARWRSPGHALPAFVLLGRIAGLSDDEALRFWREGRVEEVILEAAPPRGG